MKKNYETPFVEIIEIEVESAVLSSSITSSMNYQSGSGFGDWGEE